MAWTWHNTTGTHACPGACYLKSQPTGQIPLQVYVVLGVMVLRVMVLGVIVLRVMVLGVMVLRVMVLGVMVLGVMVLRVVQH